ncbi:hypothetical protein L3X38_045503 [Prunus dulcis]|uniref:Uncharacterized protein n=1 Tax=Prunus dulcis TaxID=3755 RepID=A0AAD4YJT8_PRUDU|nr:hypothetical protein L3X38_045503 [Prunus dulcis]
MGSEFKSEFSVRNGKKVKKQNWSIRSPSNSSNSYPESAISSPLNPSDGLFLCAATEIEVSEGSKRKRQLMRIEILPLVLSNDSEVRWSCSEGGVHGGRVGPWGCGKSQSVWVVGAGKRKRRREIVFF